MLEKVDLSKKIEKSKFKEIIPKMELKLGELQRKARDLKIPVSIVFEGWDAAGKGYQINKLILPLDPRGFNVYPINPPNEDEKLRPFLWRFWVRTPAKGRIAIFDRSWYGRVLVERVDKLVERKVWEKAYDEIKSFERQLTDDGNVILKFFLHIDKKEQKKRFKEIEENPVTAWKVTDLDWKHHKNYDRYLESCEEMFAKTDTDYSPWHIIESNNLRFAQVKIFKTIIEKLEEKIVELESKKIVSAKEKSKGSIIKLENIDSSILDKIDLSLSVTREEYEKEIDKYQERFREVEHEIYVRRIPLVIVYEGCDAGGKGGNIKRLTQELDPRGYEVISISAPNDIEKAHQYLWRFWKAFPKAGHITIFDRSWYGRVLVERVEGFCSEDEWKKAYQEINEMEEQFVNFGAVLVKFWLQIDKDEQLRRFKERQKIPYKRWKITDEDWRNRKKWGQYKEAVDEMLFRTSSRYAPWTIVESDCKHYARIKTLRTVIRAVNKKIER